MLLFRSLVQINFRNEKLVNSLPWAINASARKSLPRSKAPTAAPRRENGESIGGHLRQKRDQIYNESPRG